MTLASLSDFGVRVERARTADGERFDVRGPLCAPEAPVAVEPDASAAAVALAAACLSGGEVLVPGIEPGSRQGDVRAVEHLLAFGCQAFATCEGLWARGAPTRGAELDLEREPDLAPVLAAVAARAARDAGARSRLSGLGTLPGKESSRIEVLAEGLRAVGLAARASADALEIGPGIARASAGARHDPRGDHRMAFAFALLGLSWEGVLVSDPGCVAKSWPAFWEALERAGALVARA
jgi:3-phosphoshikimate 1-carboxyvinyltransferase